jgi:glutamyl-tRNA synthetase
MPEVRHVTRFAPSPSGRLHLGNARTALYNHLAARASGGRMVLRVEDTDAGRSDDRYLEGLLSDLRWLGVAWHEGPDVGGPHAPYRQSERGERHARAVAGLLASGAAYPCFCSPETLAIARRAQRAAGQPPRYAGTCAALPETEVARRLAAGEAHAVRFRVPADGVVTFDDLVHGAQSFATDDIGDFILRRTDGSAAFFLGNAIDDAEMGVTLVLRGDDHLANTPRQILILEALGLPRPHYGHLPLVLGPGGTPLSKRDSSAGLHELRAQGYLSAALRNYLVRLGHACQTDEWLDDGALAAHFDLSRASRSPAHFDEAQLRHWQREAVMHAEVGDLVAWLGPRLESLGDDARRAGFVSIVRGNLLFPADADALVGMVCGDSPPVEAAADAAIREAGRPFFERAGTTWDAAAGDFRAWVRALGADTGRRGADLYRPLRAALTGATHGPELAPLVGFMGGARVTARLAGAARRAGADG